MILCSLNLFSQGVVEFKDLNVLYIGYANKVVLGYNDSSADIILKAEGATVTKSADCWLVKPTVKGGQSVTLTAHKGKKKIGSMQYRVSALPAAELFWGKGRNGELVNVAEQRIDVRYPNCLLDPNFEIQSWSIETNGYARSGSGNLLYPDIYKLVSIQPNDTVNVILTVKYKKEDNSTSMLSASFKVLNPSGGFTDLTSVNKVIVIDKNENNKDLFDADNSTSLLGMISHNFYPIYRGVAPLMHEKLISERNDYFYANYNEKTIEFNGNHQTIKLVSSMNPENDSLSGNNLVYSETPSVVFSDKNIDRIILFQDSIENKITGEKYLGTKYLGLARRDAGAYKHDIVAIIPFQELASMRYTSFYKDYSFDEFNPITVQSNELLSTLNYDSISSDFDNYVMGIQSLFSPSGFTSDEISLPSYDNVKKLVRGNKEAIPWPLDLDAYQSERYQFKSIEFWTANPSTDENGDLIPLTDSFGNDSIDANGRVVYPLPDRSIKKAIGYFDIIHQYVTNPNDINHPELKCVYFVANNGKERASILAIPLDTTLANYSHHFDNIVSYLKAYTEPLTITWKESLQQEIKRSKLFDLNSSSDVMELNKLFFLDELDGLPANWFGVLVEE